MLSDNDFHMNPKYLSVFVGGTIEITCSPSTNVTWLHADKLTFHMDSTTYLSDIYSDLSLKETLHSSAIKIPSATRDHSAYYVCTGKDPTTEKKFIEWSRVEVLDGTTGTTTIIIISTSRIDSLTILFP